MPEQTVPAKVAGAVAITVATGATACAAYCVLPFALPAAALGGLGGMLALVAGALAWVTALSVVAVAGAWVWVGWQSLRTRARPAPSTLSMTGGATALTAIAVSWPRIEPTLIRALLR